MLKMVDSDKVCKEHMLLSGLKRVKIFEQHEYVDDPKGSAIDENAKRAEEFVKKMI